MNDDAKKELRKYQAEAAKEIYERKRAILADDMGLGKTAEAIAAKRLIDIRDGYQGGTLVVCPSAVKSHWYNEINKWYKKDGGIKTEIVNTSSFDRDMENAKGADFVILGYPTLSHFGRDAEKIEKLQKQNFYYGVLDEAHNAKNPESIRSGAVKDIFQSMPYLAIMSGTIIPNTVVDIYALLSYIDPNSFKLHEENSNKILNEFHHLFNQDPELISNVIREHTIRRMAGNYLHLTFPKLNQKNLEVQLEGEHKDVYLDIYRNDNLTAGTKLSYLISASIDPNIVPAEVLSTKLAARLGKMESSVYNSLDGLIENIINNNGKALIFSDRKRGVIPHLLERWKKYGAIAIHGDDKQDYSSKDINYREKLRQKFQNNQDTKVLITTTVMDEGVDLTAATDTIHLTLPYVWSSLEQRNRRSQRVGEIEKSVLNSHIVMPKIDGEVPIITQGMMNMLMDKKRIIDYILKEPKSLTKNDLLEIKNGDTHNSKHLVPFIDSDRKKVVRYLGRIKGKGFDYIQDRMEKFPEEAKRIALAYANEWDGYYGDNTSKVYRKIIDKLEEKGHLNRKLDIASGPFCLSRTIREPVTNVDINQGMLDAGRELEKQCKVVPENIAVCSPFHKMPLENNSFDLAVCSLAFHMAKPLLKYDGKELHERELALREFNRVLKDEGYGIITLPHSVIEESDLPKFYDSLNYLGFDVFPFSGFYKGENSKFRVYAATVQKIDSSPEKLLEPEKLEWRLDRELGSKIQSSSLGKKKGGGIIRKRSLPEFPTEFSNESNGANLEDILRGMQLN